MVFQKRLLCLLAGIVAAAMLPAEANAHPSSGIVVDSQGHVYFQDALGRKVWRVDADGRLSVVTDKWSGHWLALDERGSFASTAALRYFERVTPQGEKPTLLVADGGGPLAVGPDGFLYYGCNPSEKDPTEPGALHLARQSPAGRCEQFAPEVAATLKRLHQGITGVAVGADGAIYIAASSAVLRLSPRQELTIVCEPVAVDDCPFEAPGTDPQPSLRGLAADARGVVYAAATGCHCVLRIEQGKAPVTIFKSEPPWGPTGVALHAGSVYVLEYSNANGNAQEGWTPRVVKIGPDGAASTFVEVK